MAGAKSFVDFFVSQSTRQYIVNNTVIGFWWQTLSARFWATSLWLPEGIDWSDLHSTHEFIYPESSDVLTYPLLFSIVIIIAKSYFVDPLLGFLAKLAGISGKRPKPPYSNNTLEDLYKTYGPKPPQMSIAMVVEKLELPERQVERWLRLKHNSLLCTKYDKFLDCGFHLIGHTFITVHGIIILLDKPWLWNIEKCWDEYPRHNVTSELWWYYMISLAYYWASTFLQLFSASVKMSDSNQMLLHHIFTIFLMAISWTINFVRVGTIILMVHECADIPLLAAKICRYSGIESLTDSIFVVFLFVWIYTRCYLYPFWILPSIYESPILTGIPAVIVCKALLIGLLILNVIWTVLIAGIIVKKFTRGSLEDIRSDAEDLSSEDDGNVKRKDD